jgi:acyl carrier protein
MTLINAITGNDMMPNTKEQVLSILARKVGADPASISLDMRLLQDLQLDGDDAVEVILDISKACSMDISNFNTSLYFGSEPSLLSLIKLPWRQKENRQSTRSLTVGQLIEAAQAGRLGS